MDARAQARTLSLLSPLFTSLLLPRTTPHPLGAANSTRLSNADVGKDKEFVIEKGEVECSCQYDKSTQNREPGEMELRVRAKVEEHAVEKMMKAAEELRLALHARYEAAVKGLPFDAVGGTGVSSESGAGGVTKGGDNKGGEGEAKGQISEQVQAYVKDLQRSSMKRKFVRAVEYFGGGGTKAEAEVGEGAAAAAAEEDPVIDVAGRLLLTYQSLDASDIKELIVAIKGATEEKTKGVKGEGGVVFSSDLERSRSAKTLFLNSHIPLPPAYLPVELWLSNNGMGDGGIQALVTALATGMLPSLTVLRVDANGMSDLGENMLRGLRMMRKEIVVVHKQEQFRDVRLE